MFATMSQPIRLSIVIPCLNEAETLGTCIEKATRFIQGNTLGGEVVVADNGSTDGSQEIAIKAGARLVNVSIRGYGSALMGGIESAQEDFIIMGDADDSYDFTSLQPFVDALQGGADLVMGNRFTGGIRPGAMPFLHQYLGNPVLSWLARLFFRSPVGDFHCGLRGFRKRSILSLNLQTTGMEFASEMIVKATLVGLKIVEVPTVLYPDGRSRPPHLRTWSDGWRHLKFLLLYSPRWLFLYPGMMLVVIGLIISTALLPAPITLGNFTFDINTLMYASLLVILGVQSIFFAAFTHVYGANSGLLPEDKTIDQAIQRFGLERGLLISLGMIALGLISSVGAFLYWSRNQFGDIDPSISMRLVIPGALLVALGIQVFFASFFLGILNTRIKPPSSPRPETRD